MRQKEKSLEPKSGCAKRRKWFILYAGAVFVFCYRLTWMTRYLRGAPAVLQNSSANTLNLGRLSASNHPTLSGSLKSQKGKRLPSAPDRSMASSSGLNVKKRRENRYVYVEDFTSHLITQAIKRHDWNFISTTGMNKRRT